MSGVVMMRGKEIKDRDKNLKEGEGGGAEENGGLPLNPLMFF